MSTTSEGAIRYGIAWYPAETVPKQFEDLDALEEEAEHGADEGGNYGARSKAMYKVLKELGIAHLFKVDNYGFEFNGFCVVATEDRVRESTGKTYQGEIGEDTTVSYPKELNHIDTSKAPTPEHEEGLKKLIEWADMPRDRTDLKSYDASIVAGWLLVCSYH